VIYWAAGNEGRDAVAILRYLVEELGADVNIKHQYGGTPLHMAAYRGLQDSVEYLLSKGADKTVVAQNHHYMKLLNMSGTAEDFARREGHYDVVGLLTE
jgi:ankyrin repeat protein